MTKEDLNEVFTEYGQVKRVHIPVDRETGRIRGFAFVALFVPSDSFFKINPMKYLEHYYISRKNRGSMRRQKKILIILDWIFNPSYGFVVVVVVVHPD